MKYCVTCSIQNEDDAKFCSKCGSGKFSLSDPEIEHQRTRIFRNNVMLRSSLAFLVGVGVAAVALATASGHIHGLNSRAIYSCAFAGAVVAGLTFVTSKVPAITRTEVAGLLIQLIIIGGIASIVATFLAMFLATDR